MIVVLLAIPLLGAVLAYLAPGAAPRRLVLVLTGVAHAAVAATTWVAAPSPRLAGWLALDPLGRLFLSVASALFLASAVYGVAALRRELPGEREDFEEGLLFDNAPEATFAACLLLFLAAMTLVTVSQAFGLLWVGVEATTLASAPLIYFHRHHRSLEATWKYLLICSVGIALALLGNFFLAVAVGGRAPGAQQLGLPELLRDAKSLDPVWLKAAFLLFLVGYGTKMGLAPLHTWLPDAHSEAPSVVSALLSGALLNCALLGIIRAQQVCVAAGQGAFGQELLVGFGLLSMGVAAVFIPGQPDYKRMLAYSSVEHMGITSLGIGLGGVGTFGAMLHAVNHSLTKAALFFVAGNILAEYRSKSTAEVRGVLRILPASGVLWVAGLFAITGTPPFGSFLSELIVLDAALGQGRIAVAATYLVLLAVVFVGMSRAALGMAQGTPPGARRARSEPVLGIAPAATLAAVALLLGVWIPAPVRAAIDLAARALG
ncbi:MAG TPA: proton-conducting transporter membrane subunit [Candidatus Binatia bacterium]|nr:proton-conducting transporter membrane subunit [Candidatus Binatia bacterium]